MKRSPCRQRHRFLEPIHNVKDGGEPPVRGRSREDLVFMPGNALAARSGDGVGGASRDRTDDLKLAKLALSQLSYGPATRWWAGEELNLRPHAYQACALTT